MTEEPTGATVEYRLRWTGAEDFPVVLTNQFIGQVGQQKDVVLTFGQVTTPALMGTAEQQIQQARENPNLPIRTLARFTLTRTGLDELIGVLEQTRINYDKAQQVKVDGEEI